MKLKPLVSASLGGFLFTASSGFGLSFDDNLLLNSLIEIPLSINGVKLSDLEDRWIEADTSRFRPFFSLNEEDCQKLQVLDPEVEGNPLTYSTDLSEIDGRVIGILNPIFRCVRGTDGYVSYYRDEGDWANGRVHITDVYSNGNLKSVRITVSEDGPPQLYLPTNHTFSLDKHTIETLILDHYESGELNWLINPPSYLATLDYFQKIVIPSFRKDQQYLLLEAQPNIVEPEMSSIVGSYRIQSFGGSIINLINRRKGDPLAEWMDPSKTYDASYRIGDLAWLRLVNKSIANLNRIIWFNALQSESEDGLIRAEVNYLKTISVADKNFNLQVVREDDI